jgi:hypothetical protein
MGTAPSFQHACRFGHEDIVASGFSTRLASSRAIGVAVPPELLKQSDQVIE